MEDKDLATILYQKTESDCSSLPVKVLKLKDYVQLLTPLTIKTQEF